MRNYFLEAISELENLLPDIAAELDEQASERDTGERADMGTPEEAKEFALSFVDDLIERLTEARKEVLKLTFKPTKRATKTL